MQINNGWAPRLVPTASKWIYFRGETTGFLLALGVEPIEILKFNVDGAIDADYLGNTADIGFSFKWREGVDVRSRFYSFENSDVTQYAQIFKVALTVTFDTFAPRRSDRQPR